MGRARPRMYTNRLQRNMLERQPVPLAEGFAKRNVGYVRATGGSLTFRSMILHTTP